MKSRQENDPSMSIVMPYVYSPSILHIHTWNDTKRLLGCTCFFFSSFLLFSKQLARLPSRKVFTLKYSQMESTFARAAAVFTRVCTSVSVYLRVFCVCVCVCVLFRYARIVYGAVRVRGRKRVRKKKRNGPDRRFHRLYWPFRFLRSIAWSCTVAWKEKRKEKKRGKRKRRSETEVGRVDFSPRRKRKKNRGKRRVLIQSPAGWFLECPPNAECK